MRIFWRIFLVSALCIAAVCWLPSLTNVRYAGFPLLVIPFWFALRELYLARWKLKLETGGFRLFGPNQKNDFVEYAKVCQVRVLYPSISHLSGIIFSSTPRNFALTEKKEMRFTGFTVCLCHSVSTGLWFGGDSGHVPEICSLWNPPDIGCPVPLGCLSGEQRRNFWLHLHTALPQKLAFAVIFSQIPKRLDDAIATELEANKALAIRDWRTAAEAYFASAAAIWQQDGQLDGVLRCWQLRVQCLVHLGHFKEAAGFAEQVLAMARNTASASAQATALNTLAEVALRTGDLKALHGEGVAQLEEAVALHEKLCEPLLPVFRMHGNRAILWEQIFQLSNDPRALEQVPTVSGTRFIRNEPNGLWGTSRRGQGATR